MVVFAYLKRSNMQLKNGTKTVESFSLEDLMVAVKENHSEAATSEKKREKGRSSATSSSSYQANCHVRKISFKIHSRWFFVEKMMKVKM